MKRVFFHIGPHKTATTAIQRHLANGRDGYIKEGLLYPQSCWFHSGQHRLAFAMKQMVDPSDQIIPDFDVELAALRAEIVGSDAGTAFVSSEEFFSADPEAVQRLREGLADFDVRILAFLRRPDELVMSTYNQVVRNLDTDFDQPLTDFVNHPERLHSNLDLEGHLSKWIDQFGIGNATILFFEEDDPRRSVCRFVGVDEGQLADKIVNPSVSSSAIDVLRLAKSLGAEKPALQKLLRRAQRFFPADGRSPLTHEDRLAILTHYSDSLGRLLARFGMENPYAPERVNLGEEDVAEPPRERDLVAFILSFLRPAREKAPAGRPEGKQEAEAAPGQ